MLVRFYIKYATAYGDDMQLVFSDKNDKQQRIQMNYLNNEYWEAVIDSTTLDLPEKMHYSYVRRHYTHDVEYLKNEMFIGIKKAKGEIIEVLDEWVKDETYNSLFKTRPFKKLLAGDKNREIKKKDPKGSTHTFKVKGTLLPGHLAYCIIGNAKKLGEWNEERPLVLHPGDNYWVGKADLSKENFPVNYKIGIYDINLGRLIRYEDGPDRHIDFFETKHTHYIYHITIHFPDIPWKGAGINMPLSALKTEKSWGIGDFTDLNALVDFSKNCGLKLIQLLPVNDTTATHTYKDSYPYSAITAFGLHPAYLNVEKIAGISSVKIADEVMEKVKTLNKAAALDYDEVLSIKWQLIKDLYAKEKHLFKNDFNWFEFFELNRHWLTPYAVFCYLRDKNKTADFSQWGEFANFDDEKVQQLASPSNPEYDEVAIHYYVQYNLHLQLLDATKYAHKNGIALKADLPIGVGRHSVDTWMYPHLFHMNMQAGAPPDAFAVKGQNWGFPTYNWEEMAKDNYAWWRHRMEQLSNYCDAVRIDHVLGFFRIWSIPTSAVEGILGKFVPAKALYPEDFERAGMYFDAYRLCAPFVTEDILYRSFGDKTGWVQETFFNGIVFKPEFDTQREIENFFNKNPENNWAKQKLFDLLSDVVLIKDNEGGYHFRINIFETNSFKYLPQHERNVLDKLYTYYFFNSQDGLWEQEGIKKIKALRNASNNMLLCGEDLGMVPEMVPGVLHNLQILTLQVERMPKKSTDSYAYPWASNYDCVVTPSTHDMSTLREWWEEDTSASQKYFNEVLHQYGGSPFHCEPWVAQKIISNHLYATSMWTVFLLQDLLAMNGNLRRENPKDERINVPANPDHYWNYRMHCYFEDLINNETFTGEIKNMIMMSGR